jgi:hypothetical protein
MAFYDLTRDERRQKVGMIREEILNGLVSGNFKKTDAYFSDEDTYIRKAAYLSAGRIYFLEKNLREAILKKLRDLMAAEDFRMRQTAVNAAGEIGMKEFSAVQEFFDRGLFDPHHAVRNAVIGSVKKMGDKNPGPVLNWAKKYLKHPDEEVRREICHGIELRGRTHPEDILPLLRSLQFDKPARVRNTLVHVLGQIAYKKECLETVLRDLGFWENPELVKAAIEEIIDVHHRYRDFAFYTQKEAVRFVKAAGF